MKNSGFFMMLSFAFSIATTVSSWGLVQAMNTNGMWDHHGTAYLAVKTISFFLAMLLFLTGSIIQAMKGKK